MAVLTDLRATLRDALERQGLDLFVYEKDAGARAESPEQASLTEVERADIVVFVLEHTYGEVTEREYDHARALEKPCLVYTRLGGVPDDRQQLFLAKIERPRGVPSRDTFRDAVELAPKVARDVHGWLVREFRRLSASVADPGISPRQISQFAAGMDRLRAATSIDLQTGGPADLLCSQLRLWFDALDYPLDGEPTTEGRFVVFVVRIPEGRRRFRTVLVRVKDSEVLSPDVVEARNCLQAGAATARLDECWVVAPQRVSPAAREAAGKSGPVSVFTFDEVIEEDVDFTRYFDWLESEAAREKLDAFYVPLAATVNEVSSDGKPIGKSRYEDVGTYVDQWLRDPSAEHVSLLGEFGTGKSWFSLRYAVNLARNYRQAQRDDTPRPRVPLLVRLRDYARGVKDVASLLTEFVFREHEINIPNYSALQTLNRLGRLLFIFDGFDEMAARVDRQKMADNFWAMAAVLSPGSKAILTCRTEYFQFAQQARDLLGGKLRGSKMRDAVDGTRFQVAELAMFDRPRLALVLSKRADPRQVESVLANENLVDLAKRPVMVDLLIEAMPSLDAERADLARVYYLAVTRKMERDIGQHRTFTSMADKMFFMCELSAEMLFTDQMALNFKAFPERIRQYFGSAARDVEEDHWHHDLLSQTMLVRDDDGNYKPAHRSLLEFFAAYKLGAEIGALGEEYYTILRSHSGADGPPVDYRWSTFFSGTAMDCYPSAPIARFTLESEERLAAAWGRLKQDRTIGELIYLLCGPKSLKDALSSSGKVPSASVHYAARLIEILHDHRETSDLSVEGAIIRGLILTNADLAGARLSGTQWFDVRFLNIRMDGADLQGSRFHNAWLIDVTLRNARLTSLEFGEGSIMMATASGAAWGRGPQGDVLVVSSEDGRYFVVEPRAAWALEVSVPFTRGWHSNVEGVVECPPFGPVDFGRRPGTVAGVGASVWRMPLLHDAIEVHSSESSLASGVDALDVVVCARDSDSELIRYRFVDASSRGSGQPEEYFITVVPSGRMIAGVRGNSDVKTIALLRQGGDVSLAGSTGGYGTHGSFSPDESLIAVDQPGDVIGIWQTDTGKCVARLSVPIALAGAEVSGATGIPPGILRFVETHPNGWALAEHT